MPIPDGDPVSFHLLSTFTSVLRWMMFTILLLMVEEVSKVRFTHGISLAVWLLNCFSDYGLPPYFPQFIIHFPKVSRSVALLTFPEDDTCLKLLFPGTYLSSLFLHKPILTEPGLS